MKTSQFICISIFTFCFYPGSESTLLRITAGIGGNSMNFGNIGGPLHQTFSSIFHPAPFADGPTKPTDSVEEAAPGYGNPAPSPAKPTSSYSKPISSYPEPEAEAPTVAAEEPQPVPEMQELPSVNQGSESNWISQVSSSESSVSSHSENSSSSSSSSTSITQTVSNGAVKDLSNANSESSQPSTQGQVDANNSSAVLQNVSVQQNVDHGSNSDFFGAQLPTQTAPSFVSDNVIRPASRVPSTENHTSSNSSQSELGQQAQEEQSNSSHTTAPTSGHMLHLNHTESEQSSNQTSHFSSNTTTTTTTITTLASPLGDATAPQRFRRAAGEDSNDKPEENNGHEEKRTNSSNVSDEQFDIEDLFMEDYLSDEKRCVARLVCQVVRNTAKYGDIATSLHDFFLDYDSKKSKGPFILFAQAATIGRSGAKTCASAFPTCDIDLEPTFMTEGWDA